MPSSHVDIVEFDGTAGLTFRLLGGGDILYEEEPVRRDEVLYFRKMLFNK